MKILEIDQKQEEIVVKVENLNDLWTLYNIIKKDDMVAARTQRRVVLKEGTKGERKPMRLKLRVESILFHEFSNRLRIKGTIIEGPEDFVSYGAYHTFNVEPGQKISIYKEKWLKSEIKRLKKSSVFEDNFRMLIIAIETGLSTISLITNYSHSRVTTIKRNIPGKRYEQSHRNKAYTDFFHDVKKVLDENLKNLDINAIIICGPGNTRDHFIKYIYESKENYPRGKIFNIHASSGTESSVLEVLKSKELTRFKEKVKILEETEKIEEIFRLFGQNSDLIAIGMKEISEAAEKGAIKELFIVDLLIRQISQKKRLELESILNNVEATGGKINILSSEHPTGQQIIDLGSILAILRY